MNPHPRIARTLKWATMTLTALLVVAWFGSAWGYVTWRNIGLVGGGVTGGRLEIIALNPASPVPVSSGWGAGASTEPFHWWFAQRNVSGFATLYMIPLWCPVALAFGATLAAQRWEATPRRRARAGLCPNCRYDRTGIAPGAVCPECGAAASTSPPATS